MKIAILCGMSDDKARDKILPVLSLPEVNEVYLIRRKPLDLHKVSSITPPNFFRKVTVLSEVYRILSLLYVCFVKKPDVLVNIYFIPHGIYGGIIGILFRKFVIQVLIGTDRPKIEKSKILLGLLKKANRICVRGKASRMSLCSKGIPEDKIFISPGVNAIDYSLFRPMDIEKIYDLIYVGRLDKNKQVDQLLVAVAEIVLHYPELRVAIIGEGPERSYLERLTKELKIEDNITFLGKVPNVSIPNHLNQARIFVMNSAFEGLPVAMIEALCCGLPVIVPDVGDITDVAQHGVNALVMRPGNHQEMMNFIGTLLTDKDLYKRLRQGALATRESMMEDFSLTKAQEVWRNVILLARKDTHR